MEKYFCENCKSEIKRHVFCSRKCNQLFWNRNRNGGEVELRKPKLEVEKKVETPIEEQTGEAKPKIQQKVFDTRMCPKHKVFMGSCGCK